MHSRYWIFATKSEIKDLYKQCYFWKASASNVVVNIFTMLFSLNNFITAAINSSIMILHRLSLAKQSTVAAHFRYDIA